MVCTSCFSDVVLEKESNCAAGGVVAQGGKTLKELAPSLGMSAAPFSRISEQGVDLFLSVIPDGQSELSVIRTIVTTRRADGLVLGRTSELDAWANYLMTGGFPFVTHGRVLEAGDRFS